MESFNIYITGVGGQGTGLLSEIIVKAADLAGKNVTGTDTHGLAQRGGMVESTIRIGDNAHSPLIMKQSAHLVIALEIHEAYLGAAKYLRKNGALIYYKVSMQPLFTRLGKEKEVTVQDINILCESHNAQCHEVFDKALTDPKFQNIALLGEINRLQLIPDISAKNYLDAMKMLMGERVYELNESVFNQPL